MDYKKIKNKNQSMCTQYFQSQFSSLLHFSLRTFFGDKHLQKETQPKVKALAIKKTSQFLGIYTGALTLLFALSLERREVAAFTKEKLNHLINC